MLVISTCTCSLLILFVVYFSIFTIITQTKVVIFIFFKKAKQTITKTSDVTDTKFCVRSPQVFFICDTALHHKVVSKNSHCTAPQIIYLNKNFLDIFSFFKKVFIQTIFTVVVIKISLYISDSIAIGNWHNSYWH